MPRKIIWSKLLQPFYCEIKAHTVEDQTGAEILSVRVVRFGFEHTEVWKLRQDMTYEWVNRLKDDCCSMYDRLRFSGDKLNLDF